MIIFEPTVHLSDIALALGLVYTIISKANKVPELQGKLDALFTKFDDLNKEMTHLAVAISSLQGSFETYKELKNGKSTRQETTGSFSL